MTDFFFEAHSIWMYLTVAAVLVAIGFSFQKEMTPTSERVYRLTTVVVDIQVALGIVLWLFDSGWSLGLMQGWIHPIVGLAALGVLHVFVGKAREADPADANKVVRIGIWLATILVVGAIGIAEMV